MTCFTWLATRCLSCPFLAYPRILGDNTLAPSVSIAVDVPGCNPLTEFNGHEAEGIEDVLCQQSLTAAMNWRVKARIQNAVASLPSSLSYAMYYWMQRRFGGLRHLNPVNRIVAGVEICKRIVSHGKTPVGKVFFELGTGRRFNMPLALWLLGAEKVITVDLNPYIKEDLVREDIKFIKKNRVAVEDLFKGNDLVEDRFEELVDYASKPWRMNDLLSFCNIEYVCPGDATNLPIQDSTVDYYTSYTVLEHIPPAAILRIFREGNRITRDDGLFIHRIDYSDHFSHSDRSISSINFLQFSDGEWDKIAGNRYMYMNRLRFDDFEDLYRRSQQRILSIEAEKDPAVVELLKDNALAIDERFEDKSRDVLATVNTWIVSEKSV